MCKVVGVIVNMICDGMIVGCGVLIVGVLGMGKMVIVYGMVKTFGEETSFAFMVVSEIFLMEMFKMEVLM